VLNFARCGQYVHSQCQNGYFIAFGRGFIAGTRSAKVNAICN